MKSSEAPLQGNELMAPIVSHLRKAGLLRHVPFPPQFTVVIKAGMVADEVLVSENKSVNATSHAQQLAVSVYNALDRLLPKGVRIDQLTLYMGVKDKGVVLAQEPTKDDFLFSRHNVVPRSERDRHDICIDVVDAVSTARRVELTSQQAA